MVIIPRVTIKGATVPRVITSPFSAPMARPAVTATARGTISGNSPGWANKAAITPVKATTEPRDRSEEHTSELQSLMRISYAVFCLKKKRHQDPQHISNTHTNKYTRIPIDAITQTH